MYTGPNPKRDHEPNDTRRIRVHSADLPVHCPLPEMSLWNSHPQVYIPLEKPGDHEICPYCGTRFMLEADDEETGARTA